MCRHPRRIADLLIGRIGRLAEIHVERRHLRRQGMVDEGTQLRLQEFVVSPVTDDAQSLRIDTIPQRVEQELALV